MLMPAVLASQFCNKHTTLTNAHQRHNYVHCIPAAEAEVKLIRRSPILAASKLWPKFDISWNKGFNWSRIFFCSRKSAQTEVCPNISPRTNFLNPQKQFIYIFVHFFPRQKSVMDVQQLLIWTCCFIILGPCSTQVLCVILSFRPSCSCLHENVSINRITIIAICYNNNTNNRLII